MELGPIPGIRALPALRARQADFRPPAIFEIDAPVKPGESDGQHAGRKAAGAEEGEEEEWMLDGEARDDGERLEVDAVETIDYFA